MQPRIRPVLVMDQRPTLLTLACCWVYISIFTSVRYFWQQIEEGTATYNKQTDGQTNGRTHKIYTKLNTTKKMHTAAALLYIFNISCQTAPL